MPGLCLPVVDVTLSRRIDPGQAGDEYRDEQGSGNLLNHAYAARLARERRHVSEARAGEHGYAQVKGIGIDQPSRLPDDHVRLGIEESDDRVKVRPEHTDLEIRSRSAEQLILRHDPRLEYVAEQIHDGDEIKCGAEHPRPR